MLKERRAGRGHAGAARRGMEGQTGRKAPRGEGSTCRPRGRGTALESGGSTGGSGDLGKGPAPSPAPALPHHTQLALSCGAGPASTETLPRGTLTSARVEAEGVVQDDAVQEQGRGVHLHRARQQPAEELHVPAERGQLSAPSHVPAVPRRPPRPAGARRKTRGTQLLLGSPRPGLWPTPGRPTPGAPYGEPRSCSEPPACLPCAGKARLRLKLRVRSLACLGAPCALMAQGGRPWREVAT